ncbi:MFS transporter [Brevundimonas faecalis]|uniref:EmrB/QacA subfamily drug resistance transporter n=1 Tax=Brevundimonas faecalis TaxID=947378 RepID=A0ABV2RAZ9_9CAUL
MPLTRPGRDRLTLAAVALSSLMFGLEISSVPVILPTLEQRLGADFVQLQWVMNAYTIAVASVLMAAGTLADRFGRKRLFLIGVAAFGATSLVCGATNDVGVLIGARFLQGAAGGIMLICQVAILSHQFREGRARSVAFGWWGVVFGIGLGFGPIIGSGIVAVAGWEWVFLVHVALAVLVLLLALAGVEESRSPQAGRLDAAGMLTLSVAVLGLTAFITEGPRLGFQAPLALTILAVSVVCFIAFVVVERRAAHPMFDFGVFRLPTFSGALAGAVGMNLSFWPLIIYLPIWFQAGLGLSPVGVGAALLLYTLPTLILPPVAERMLLRFGPGFIVPLGLFIIGLGLIVMRIGLGLPDSGWAITAPGLLLAGAGLGLTNTPVTNAATAAVSSDRAGMASGMDMSARMITLAINIAIMGAILFNGVLARLKADGGSVSGDLHRMAERIAAGSPGSGAPTDLAHAALSQGFGLVMLYGGIGCWILAATSAMLFRGRGADGREQECAARPV